jgi:hypothetical protein
MVEQRYREEIDRFQAKDDEGNTFTVIEYQNIVKTTLINRPDSIMRGTKAHILSTGLNVEFIDDETFKIVKTDTVIKRVR